MPVRRFSVADLMLFIASTAVGLALVRVHFGSMEAWSKGGPPGWLTYPNRLRFAAASPMLASWSLALLILQLKRPRVRFRRLASSPGFAASYAATFGIALCLVTSGLDLIAAVLAPGGGGPALFHFNNRLNCYVGLAVAAVWISLASGGRWRRGAGHDWRELSGQALGAAWMLLFVLCQFNLLGWN